MISIFLLFIFLCPFLSITTSVDGSTICSSNPCLNGVCVVQDSNSSSSNFSCFCLDGFTGKLCDRKFDECLQGRNPCQNNATCVNSTPTSRCICPEGYCGRYCEMEIDECHSNPCLNGGMCLDKLNGYQCLCPLGYSGLRCEVDIDACDPDVLRHLNLTRHCENGGTCKDGPGQEYFCVCPRGYTGGRCETMMDECGSGPCLNGARCEKLVGGFNCVCAYGWTGTVCDRPLRKCSPTNHCKNPSALCMEPEEDHSPSDYFCYCPPDYHGKHCELRYNECQPNNCLNNGTCVDGVDGYECHCVDNWGGKNCEVDCEEEVEREVEGVGQVCGSTTTSTPTTIQVTVTPAIETAATTTPPTSATITIEPSFPLPSPSTSPEVPPTSTTPPPTSTSPPTSTATTSAPPTSTPPATPIPTSPTISTSISTPPTSVLPTSASPTSVTHISVPPTSVPPTSTPPSSVPPTSAPHTLDPTIRRIYAPSFTTPTSSLTFRVRRVKRQSSTLKFDLIPHKDPASGTILYANTSRYHLHLYLQDNRLVSKLWDGKQPNSSNFLELRSSFPLESSQRYTVQLSLTAVKETPNSISAELTLWNRTELLSSISGIGSNITVPCFECYQLGGAQLEFNPQSFDGCILNFEINGQEKFPKDAFAASNVSECSGQELVCSQMKPCRNGGFCNNGTDGSWECKCPVGFRGWLCDEVYCDGNICGNGGLCLVSDNRHVCVCAAGFYGLRCEFKMNLTFPLFNISPNGSSSYIKYRLPYDMKEFFEIRFRFIAHDLDQKNGLLMFMSELSGSGSSSSSTNPLVTTTEMSPRTSVRDFISLVYEEKNLALRMNLGQGEKTLRAPTEQNTTEQMVLFGRFHQTFWLLVVPVHLGTNGNKNGSTGLQPQVGRMPLHHRYLNVDPYLYVGGHEDWRAHLALGNLVGFKGCIYDIDIRNSRAANFTRLEDKLIDNLANIEQCDFDCT